MIDLFSRQVVGWSMRDHMQASVVTDALRMAWFRRRPEPGLIFHADRGSQYCSHEFQDALKDYEMKSSMSRKGNCWESLPHEVLWAQRADREPVGSVEGGPAVRQEVCHPTRGHGRGDGLAELLQPPEIALDAGPCQPHDV